MKLWYQDWKVPALMINLLEVRNIHCLSQFSLAQWGRDWCPALQIKKLRLREVKQFIKVRPTFKSWFTYQVYLLQIPSSLPLPACLSKMLCFPTPTDRTCKYRCSYNVLEFLPLTSYSYLCLCLIISPGNICPKL